MSFKELFEKPVDFIDKHRKSIVRVSVSILGLILLMIVFFMSSNELSVGKETDNLVEYIEKRSYKQAMDYYKDIEKDFSDSKMKRFNKSVSKKIDRLLLNSGDKYINGEITKDHYIGIINMINSLDNITLDLKKIVDQADRVNEMYKEENIKTDVAMSYINAISTLNGMRDELDSYKKNIKLLSDSRETYEIAVKDQKFKKYYEAITGYDKVLEEDKRYYNMAKKAKEECIDLMYNYYIEKSEESNKAGNYEEALQYIDYLKPYYVDDEKIQKLERTYQKNLSLYTLTSEDIINLIVKKSGKHKDSITINSLQQMIGDNKYYYVEVFEYDKLVDEILVDPKVKKIYSYKDSNKNYNSEYSDGYFKVDESGKFSFSISEGEAEFLLENRLEEKNENYKSITIVSESKANRYIDGQEKLDDLLGKDKDIYHYAIVNKGFFKKKQVYIVNIYNKKIYSVSNEGIKNY